MIGHLSIFRAQWHQVTGGRFRDDCLLIGNIVLWTLVLINCAARVLP